MSRQTDIQTLIINYSRQLQKLKEQESLLGLSTPSAILLQIEDVETKLEELHTDLQDTKSDTEPRYSGEGSLSSEIEQELKSSEINGPLSDRSQIGSINVNHVHNSPVSINQSTKIDTGGGDIVSGNKTSINRDRRASTYETPQVKLEAALVRWQQEIIVKLAVLTELEADERKELQEKAAKVAEEAAKGIEGNPAKLERLINTMSSMAPDIIEITAKTLQNPLAGVGLILEKINDKTVRLKRQTS